MKIKTINERELDKILADIKKTNSTSADNISMNTLVKLKLSCTPLLTHMINRTIETGIFPEVLKISKIVPIKKNNKDNHDPANFCPVNLLSPLSKVIEKTWSIQIERHLRESKSIDANMQGSIKK